MIASARFNFTFIYPSSMRHFSGGFSQIDEDVSHPRTSALKMHPFESARRTFDEEIFNTLSLLVALGTLSATPLKTKIVTKVSATEVSVYATTVFPGKSSLMMT